MAENFRALCTGRSGFLAVIQSPCGVGVIAAAYVCNMKALELKPVPYSP